ncbi:M48 family metallopeptidase [Salinarimonas soli]|uniref:M48 family metallopeptidase n=1 Tax=Salinarimonas soli TaxID=1638099 RepID=A0A5B2V9Y4_9HYPH|nr:M48 family metallopeptidase [Salinarimonas soli]KAA2235047.1 M48 family metallopeptidase [Salinarimonas soli]
MSPVFGLYTHIHANRRKSALLVVGLGLLVYGLVFGVALLLRGLGWFGTVDTFTGHVAAASRDLLWAAPAATALTALWVFVAYKAHQWIIDAVTGARPVERADDPALYALLENLCISRGMSVPALRIIKSDALNAFASGLDERHYTITLTRGIVAALDARELETVLAHELTHIRNEDVRLMVVAVIVTGIISFVGEMIFRGGRDMRVSGGSSRSEGSDRKRGGGGALPAILLAILVIAVAWFLSQVIRFSLSRSREFLADAGAVELTKNPDALISALLKIQGRGELEGVPSGIMDMCVDNPNSGFVDLFSSHPSIEDRIEALVLHAGGRRPLIAASAAEPTLTAGPWGAVPET